MSSDAQWDFTPDSRSRVVSAEPSRHTEAPSPPAPPPHPRPQRALSPVRTQCPSRSPAPARRPGASPQECGLGPGSGRQDSRGGNTMESPDPGRGPPRSPHHPPTVHSCPGWEPSTRHIYWLPEGCGVQRLRLHQWEGATDPKSWGAEGPGGGGGGTRAEKAPLQTASTAQTHTQSPTHLPTSLIPNTCPQISHKGSLK